MALALIHSQSKRENCSYVFPSEASDQHLVGLPRVLQRICATARIEGITLHMLRHTFGSIAGELATDEVSWAIAQDYIGKK